MSSKGTEAALIGPVCLDPVLLENATLPLVGDLTFYHVNVLISATATAIITISAFLLIFLHGTHFSNPAQQTKIIRIAMFLPVYSIYSFLCVLVAEAQVSLLPWQDLVEAFAMGNFFLLLLELISPHEDQRSLFFVGMRLRTPQDGMGFRKKKQQPKKPQKPVDPLLWYRRKWVAIFQYVVVSMIVGIITDVTQAVGKYCNSSYNPKFAHLWMEIIINISQSIAITAIILFYQTCSKELATHRPLAKLVAFKLVIFFIFVTGILFMILQGTGAMKPTATLTYADIKVGIPTLAQLLFLVPLSFFFHYAYSYRFYQFGGRHYIETGKPDIPGFTPSYQGGFLGIRAYLAAMNPLETFQAMIFAVKLFLPSSRHYIENRRKGPDGHKYATSLQNTNSNTSGAPSDRPGFEPLRYGGQSDDYAMNATQHQSHNQPHGIPQQYGTYANVPNPTIQEPEGGMGYGAYDRAGRNVSPPSRSHSRSPSREQFLPPSVGQPGTYSPLPDRQRY